jgi:peptidoglycan/xylan/chitin deacetylase (PgdA/CDA1 family)
VWLARLAWILGALSLFRKVANRYEIKKSGRARSGFPPITRRSRKAVQILIYHRVNDDRDPFFPALTIADFRKQMEYITEKYRPYSLGDAIESIESNDIPDNAIVVTFDDGYRDNYTNAFPILRDLSVPATIFLATGVTGSDKRLWHDIIFSAFRATTVCAFRDFPEKGSVWPMRNISEKLTALQRVLQFLWSVSENERARRIDQVVDSLKARDCDRGRLMLSWSEVGEMYKHGISFGSHTVTHPILSTLSDCRLRTEIVESKRVIEKQLGCKVNAFAYPVGRSQDFDWRAKAVLQEHGYRCAVTTIFGANSERQDLFELRRGTPWEPDLPSFAMKLAWYKFAQTE